MIPLAPTAVELRAVSAVDSIVKRLDAQHSTSSLHRAYKSMLFVILFYDRRSGRLPISSPTLVMIGKDEADDIAIIAHARPATEHPATSPFRA